MPYKSPCSRRSAVRLAAAIQPKELAVGRLPIAKEQSDIVATDTSIIGSLPMRSAIGPNSAAPSGRAAKVALKTASALNVLATASSAGKNCGAKKAARSP